MITEREGTIIAICDRCGIEIREPQADNFTSVDIGSKYLCWDCEEGQELLRTEFFYRRK